ncbi:hypothetical protein GJAV_G00138250 [Gymnothorax javanicus]|nr:hypothetical protein GJAV_G00138250 [Gymnothorax javanicus]
MWRIRLCFCSCRGTTGGENPRVIKQVREKRRISPLTHPTGDGALTWTDCRDSIVGFLQFPSSSLFEAPQQRKKKLLGALERSLFSGGWRCALASLPAAGSLAHLGRAALSCTLSRELPFGLGRRRGYKLRCGCSWRL